MSKSPDDGNRFVRVVLWMMGALTSYGVAAISIRQLALHFNVFEIGAIRTGGGLIVLLLALVARPSLGTSLRSSRALPHLMRNLTHALGGILWTLSIIWLPLATVFSLEFTAPAWAALFAYSVVGERITKDTVIGIAASLVGVLIILRPSPGTFDAVALFPLAAAVCFGISVLLTRRLLRTERVFSILLWMMIIQLPINLVGAVFAPAGRGAIGTLDVAAMASLAIAGLCSQFCLSKALRIGQAILVMPMDFVRVPLIAVVGSTLYGEPIDIWVFVGFVIILGGIAIGLLPARLYSSREDPVDLFG